MTNKLKGTGIRKLCKNWGVQFVNSTGKGMAVRDGDGGGTNKGDGGLVITIINYNN